MKEVQVTRYQTNDGLLFTTKEEAEKHEAGEDIKVLEDKMENLDKTLKEIEIPLKEGMKTAPLDIYLSSGSDGRSLLPKLKEGQFRYFMLRDDKDAETLARYTILKRKHWYKKHDFDQIEWEEKNGTPLTEEDVTRNIKEFPCVAFISSENRGYGDMIGTFLGEMEYLKEYCHNNGYTLKLIREN